jgi:MFS family permease
MTRDVTLGIRANAPQFFLLVAINALVGAMVGIERSTLPLIGRHDFHLTSSAALTTFLIGFGLAKSAANFASGPIADHYNRRITLILGWSCALPVPLLVAYAPSWGWIVAANLLLGVSQGLAWSSTVVMKIDLAGPARRGLAMGLNEAAGYGAVSLAALAAGLAATSLGLRHSVVEIGTGISIVGLLASLVLVRDTRAHAHSEQQHHAAHEHAEVTSAQAMRLASWTDPTLATASHVGLVNNLNDGLAWGVLPVYFASHGASTAQIGVLAAAYPFVWGVGQLGTGWASDHLDRRAMIAVGMLLQGLAIAALAATSTFALWVVALAFLGFGTALVYPTLLAAVSDAAPPSWRARALGVYRMWRDLGYVAGAVLTGVVADAYGMRTAILTVAAITAAAGLLARLRMRRRPATSVHPS